MQSLLDSLIDWFALPRNGLSSVFLVAFMSATLLPMGSEPAVFGYVKLNPGDFWLTVAVATVANTLGGGVNYWMGRGAHSAVARDRETRSLQWLQRFGPKALLLSWLPVVGDPLCAVAGWLRMPFWACMVWQAVGKFLRYVTMTAALLWVPNDWWHRLFAVVSGG